MNLSIGDPVGCGAGTDVASQAVDAAVAAGIVVVTAAGNSGPANCTVKSPGAAESALTVGAMADTGAGGFSQAWFSSRGPTADGRDQARHLRRRASTSRWPSPAAAMIAGSGTSAAAPFSTGTALLMLQVDPALTPARDQADASAHRGRLGPPRQGHRVRRRPPRRLCRTARRGRAAGGAAGGARAPSAERHARRG